MSPTIPHGDCPETLWAGCPRTERKAVRCPVCNGSGSIPCPDATSTAAGISRTCHGCGGKGWVTV